MTEASPEAALWNLLRGALATRALAVVADLHVADVLADGPLHVDHIAREVGADADTLHRILRALASDGLFVEVEARTYRNSDASSLLREGSGWRDFAHLCGGIWYGTVGALDARGRGPAFERTFGTDFWSWLAEHPDERSAFDRAMEQGKERRVDRLAALPWRGDETVVDVGGGNGSLLVELLRRHPGLRGIVFDLPETVRDDAALGDGCTFVEGDFFEAVPPGDVYVLSTVLHDSPDEQAAAILRTIRSACDGEGRLVVVDAVIPAGNGSHGAKWLDLLVLALAGGRERDEEQWRALLDATGFEPLRIDDGLVEARCR